MRKKLKEVLFLLAIIAVAAVISASDSTVVPQTPCLPHQICPQTPCLPHQICQP